MITDDEIYERWARGFYGLVEEEVIDRSDQCRHCNEPLIVTRERPGQRSRTSRPLLEWDAKRNLIKVHKYVEISRDSAGSTLVCAKCAAVVGQDIANEVRLLKPFDDEDGGGGGGRSSGGNKRKWNYNTHEFLQANPMQRDKEQQRIFQQGQHQPYKRRYHFNERIKMRNNTEPRIPIDKLLHIRVIVLALLPRNFRPDDINAKTVQMACRAVTVRDPLTGKIKRPLYQYAERWLQVRYFLLTGNTANQSSLAYDVPLLTDLQVHHLVNYFLMIERVFDEMLYLSSTTSTTVKDQKCGKPGEYAGGYIDPVTGEYFPPEHARHNLMQYNYVIHQAVIYCFGYERYFEMRTEFCFPMHKSKTALKRLNEMMRVICNRLGIPVIELPLRTNASVVLCILLGSAILLQKSDVVPLALPLGDDELDAELDRLLLAAQLD